VLEKRIKSLFVTKDKLNIPLQTKFKNNTLITKFNELGRFTGLIYMAENAFYKTTNLLEIELPISLTNLRPSSSDLCACFYKSGIVEIDLKNVVTVGAGSFNACPNLLRIKAKKVQNIRNELCRNAPKISRIILPSLRDDMTGYISANLAYGANRLSLVDIGPNLKTIGTYIRYKSNSEYGGSWTNTTVVIRSKNFTINKLTFQGCYRTYCTEEMLSYLTNSSNNSYTYNATYVIGGEQWIAQFGSSDPYANLTQEEYDYYYKDMVEGE